MYKSLKKVCALIVISLLCEVCWQDVAVHSNRSAAPGQWSG